MYLTLRICVVIFSAFLAMEADTGFAHSFQGSLVVADKGDVFEQYQTGLNYYYGQGVPVDKQKAAGWFEMSVEGGLPWGADILSDMYQKGDGVKKDQNKARYYAAKSANFKQDMRLHPEKYVFINDHLHQIEKDQTRELLARAQSGDLEAQRIVAQNYEQGSEGFERNEVEAFSWYIKAADQGDGEAMHALANLLISSDKVAPDLSPKAAIDQAVTWMKKGIDAGSGLPQDVDRIQNLTPDGLAETRLYGRLSVAEQVIECVQNKTLPCSDDEKRQALLVIKQAAEGGNSWAQYLWGALLLQANSMQLLGQTTDPAGAISYLLKASEAEVPEAMMLLAKHYERGDNAVKNFPEAIRLYDRVVAYYEKNNASGGDGSEAICRLHYLRGDKIEPYQEENCNWFARDYVGVSQIQ